MTIKPVRIQLSRAPGFRLQAHSHAVNGLNAIKVDRSTRWGNPYRIGLPLDMKQARRWGWNISPAGQHIVCVDTAEAVRHFAHALLWDGAMHDYLRAQLGGRNLACWCALGDPCHADPLLWLSNSTTEQIDRLMYCVDQRIIAESELVTAAAWQ